MSEFAPSVNAEIRRVLKESGVSQRELAKRMHVTEERVCHILNSQANLTLRSIDKVFAALGYAATLTAIPTPTPADLGK